MALTQNVVYRQGRQGNLQILGDTATEGGTRPGRASLFLNRGEGRRTYQRVATPKPQSEASLSPIPTKPIFDCGWVLFGSRVAETEEEEEEEEEEEREAEGTVRTKHQPSRRESERAHELFYFF